MSAGVDSEFPFTMVVDDPSGNSFVENPSAPNRDPALTVSEGKNRGSRGQGRVSSGYSIVCYREFMIQFVCVFVFAFLRGRGPAPAVRWSVEGARFLECYAVAKPFYPWQETMCSGRGVR